MFDGIVNVVNAELQVGRPRTTLERTTAAKRIGEQLDQLYPASGFELRWIVAIIGIGEHWEDLQCPGHEISRRLSADTRLDLIGFGLQILIFRRH